MTPFNPAAIIAKKRDGQSLTCDEVAAFIGGFAAGSVPDYQMSALAMAIYLRGMDRDETVALTEQMLSSGLQMTWPDGPPRVDKHSTGGVGDKVSLLLAPLLACCGLHVPMISGRGLGPTGGTLDKLESIPGLRTDLDPVEIRDITSRVGCVIAAASAEIAPADRKLYALRDVTATVASIPLITASIMSKKLAEGLDALVLDVKVGSGAFMKTVAQARDLATSLCEIGQQMNVTTTALLTDMDQPLGRTAGNALEVDEAVAALSGSGPADVVALASALGSELLLATGQADSLDDGLKQIARHVDSGAGLEKLREMVAAQGGDLDTPRHLAVRSVVVAEDAGYVSRVDVEALGYAVIDLGGGRRRINDKIDHSVGIEMLVRVGDRVDREQPLIGVFATPDQFERICPRIAGSITISDTVPSARPLVIEQFGSVG